MNQNKNVWVEAEITPGMLPNERVAEVRLWGADKPTHCFFVNEAHVIEGAFPAGAVSGLLLDRDEVRALVRFMGSDGLETLLVPVSALRPGAHES